MLKIFEELILKEICQFFNGFCFKTLFYAFLYMFSTHCFSKSLPWLLQTRLSPFLAAFSSWLCSLHSFWLFLEYKFEVVLWAEFFLAGQGMF